MDLSLPEGASVSSGISRDLCSLHYASIDDAIKFICELGPDSLLAKLDLEKAWEVCGVEEVLRLSFLGHPGVSTPGIGPLSTPSTLGINHSRHAGG